MEPAATDVKQLLTQANLARVRGNWAEAERKCHEATAAAPDNAEAWELLGDAAYAQRKGSQAINYYRHAHSLSPGRLALEDKIGRASLLIAQQEMIMAAPDLYLSGRQSKRLPAMAALFSFILPGLGQLYNRQWWKAAVVGTVYLGAVLLLGRSATVELAPLWAQGGRGADLMHVIDIFWTGPRLVFGAVSVLAWVFAIADAAYHAGQGEREPSNELAP